MTKWKKEKDNIEGLLKDHSYKEIAEMYGVTYNAFAKVVRRLFTPEERKELQMQNVANFSTIRMNPNGEMTKQMDGFALMEVKDKSPEDLLTIFGFNPEKFAVQNSYVNNYGDRSSVRLTVKPKEEAVDVTELLEQVQQLTPKVYPYAPVMETKQEAVLPLFDMHIGFEDPEQVLRRLMSGLEKVDSHLDKITVILGGDFLNSEPNGETSSGTKVDETPDVTKMIVQAVSFLSDLKTTLLAKYTNEVNIQFVAGNHDYYIAQVMMSTLQAVGVLDAQDWNKISGWVDVLGTPIAFYHGGGIKKARIKNEKYFDYLYTQHPDAVKLALSTGRNIVMYTGHLHFQEFSNEHNVQVKQVPVIADNSKYEIENGFVGTQNRGLLDIYDTEGLLQTVWY